MLTALVVAPLICAALAFLVPSNRLRPWLLPLGAALQLALACRQVFVVGHSQVAYAGGGWLALDPLGCLFLLLIATLFLLCAGYAPGYLRERAERDNRLLCADLFLSLSMMTLVVVARHLGLMWLAMAAAVPCAGPGIAFNRAAGSRQAVRKYLLIGSVGSGLALFGLLMLAYSSLHFDARTTLLLDNLLREAPQLSPERLRVAFIMLLVGYGTLLGLAPLHAGQRAACGEAPGLVGALLAGGMTSGALLCVLRIHQVVSAAGKLDYAQAVLIFMGLVSMLFAAARMIGSRLARQQYLKRLLADCVAAQMGIVLLGIGVGGSAIYFALFHAVNLGLTGVALFLAAGAIQRAYGSQLVGDVQGVARRLPVSGWALLIGFLAIMGSPPFSPFLSELGIVSAAFNGQHDCAVVLCLGTLWLAFLAFGSAVTGIVFGKPAATCVSPPFRNQFMTGWPIVAALAIVLTLGVATPPSIDAVLRTAGDYLEHPLDEHWTGERATPESPGPPSSSDTPPR